MCFVIEYLAAQYSVNVLCKHQTCLIHVGKTVLLWQNIHTVYLVDYFYYNFSSDKLESETEENGIITAYVYIFTYMTSY